MPTHSLVSDLSKQLQRIHCHEIMVKKTSWTDNYNLIMNFIFTGYPTLVALCQTKLSLANTYKDVERKSLKKETEEKLTYKCTEENAENIWTLKARINKTGFKKKDTTF